jgi:predicted permease
LLIACLNLANMILARGAARRGEIWIRQSLGGGRSRLIRQVMTEGALLAIAGGVIALGWSYFANTRIVAAIAEAIPLDLTVAVDLRPDARVLGATVISCIVATLLFGFVPALRVTKQDLASGIKQGAFATAFKRSRGGKLLSVGSTMIVAQIALSLVMLTVGGLFIRSTVVAANALPPFSLDDILLVELHTGLAGYDEPRSVAIYKNVLERVRSLPDVQHAGMTSLVPLSGISQARSLKPAGTPQDLPGVGGHFSTVTDGYFDALGLPVSRGRDFTEAEIESGTTPPVAIIDDAFATQLFPDGDALGRQVQGVSFDADGEPIALTIVGIAPPLPGQDIDPAPRRHAYVPYRQAYNSNMTVVIAVRDGLPDPSTLLPTIRQLIRAIDPALPILSVKSMRTLRSENWSLRMLTLGSRLFMLLGAAALCLAMVGLYGVKSFLISQRTREIGVRMALGATRSDVQRALLRQSLAVTALGLGVGCIVAIAVGRIVSSMLYGVSGMDGLVLSSATVLLAAAAMLASFLPVLRATRSQPIAALRYE